MSHKLSMVAVAVMGVLVSGWTVAASNMGPESGSGFDPKTLRPGGVEVMPWLGLIEGANSNVGSSNTKTSSTFTMLNPNVVVGIPTRGQFYGGKYSGAYARFASSGIDNYNDHNIGLFADNAWSGRLNTLVNVDYNLGHDGRNSLMFKNKELWHTTGIKGMAHYGAEGAQGQFEVGVGQMNKRYDSNNGGSTQLYNYDRTDLKGTFFYKVAPATQMFVEASNAKFVYADVGSKVLDSNEQRYMVGVKWDATAKTTGNFKIGTLKKTFNLGKPSGTATVWDADINWTPKTYSRFDASLHQTAFEAGGSGNYVVSRDTMLKWSHDWTSYVTSAVTLDDAQDTFQASAPSRVDKRQFYSLKATYGFRPWLRAGLEFKNTKRNSSVSVWNYTQAITMLSLEGSL